MLLYPLVHRLQLGRVQIYDELRLYALQQAVVATGGGGHGAGGSAQA